MRRGLLHSSAFFIIVPLTTPKHTQTSVLHDVSLMTLNHCIECFATGLIWIPLPFLFINVHRLGRAIPYRTVRPKVHPEKEGVQIGLVHSNRLHRDFKYEQHPNLTDKGQVKGSQPLSTVTMYKKCPYLNLTQSDTQPSPCQAKWTWSSCLQHDHFSETLISVKVYILRLIHVIIVVPNCLPTLFVCTVCFRHRFRKDWHVSLMFP